MWKNIVEPGRLQRTIWRMRIACWIPKATNTPSEYVVLTPFPLQQWMHERFWMLRYTYIACLLVFYFFSTTTMDARTFLDVTLHVHCLPSCILLLFHYNNGCTNVSRCYVTRTLPVFSYNCKRCAVSS